MTTKGTAWKSARKSKKSYLRRGSFAEMKDSVSGIWGSFVEMQGSFEEISESVAEN